MELSQGKHRAVLVLLTEGNLVCLPLKKTKIGAGRRNGYGGGVELGETEREAAVRELSEESGPSGGGGVSVQPEDLKLVAIIEFHNHLSRDMVCVVEMYVFQASAWTGIPEETDAMGKPEWFPNNRLPMSEMMVGDGWLPLIFALPRGHYVRGEVHYEPGQTALRGNPIFNITPTEKEA